MQTAEYLKDRGISLFSLEDDQCILPEGGGIGGLVGKEYHIMNIGSARLGAYREIGGNGCDKHAGIAIIDNKIERGNEDQFMQMGLNKLQILIKLPPKIKFKAIKTSILLPDPKYSILQASFDWEDPWDFHYDYDFNYDNPPYSVYCTDMYKAPGIRSKVGYFVPEDPVFLSRLRFGFSFVS